MGSISKALLNVDRRWIFLLITLAVLIPILTRVVFDEYPTPPVNNAFDAIDNLPPGSNILLSYDYDPGSAPELQPMATAITWHAAKKGHKIFLMALWPLGVNMMQNTEAVVMGKEFKSYTYGEDYVTLGFRTGGEGLIRLVCTNLREGFPLDDRGSSLADIPVTRDITNLQDMDLIVSISAGAPGAKEWIQYAGVPYDIPVISACTGVQSPLLYPYYPQQMVGLIGAIKGAAEYEARLKDEYDYGVDAAGNRKPELTKGMERMGPQLFAHLLILLLIITGNIILFVQRRAKEGR